MSDAAPDWLLTMRALTGKVVETPGAGNNEKIMGMADEIGRIWPDMRTYCDQYRADATPWCGLACAYVVSKANLRPPFGDTDTDKFLWARSWSDDPNYDVLKVPRLGCIVVLSRSGGGHVSLYESTSGSNYMLRGGNQSDAITLAKFPTANVVAMVWPRDAAAPPPIEPPAEKMPILRKGDTGASVAYLQSLLPRWIDGDFGSHTEQLVREFQRTSSLSVDGVVGQATWAALLDEEPPPPPPPVPASGWIHDITATVFGSYEGEQSAYGGELDDSEPFVALPMRFSGERPDVEVMNEDGEVVEAEIMDVGPWMIDDRAYVIDGKRPVAEQCFASKTPIPSGPQKGRVPSNPAGIDLSPSLAKALGIEGMGKVSWRLIP